ncbi:hypothetical protein ACLMNJ_17295 [Streptomyces seoulensis]
MPRQPQHQPKPRSPRLSRPGRASRSLEHGGRSPRRGGPDPRRVRLAALAAVVVCAAVLPLAVASAGQVGGRDGTAGAAGARMADQADVVGGASGAGRVDGVDGVAGGVGRAGGRDGSAAWSAGRSLPDGDDKMPAAPRRSPLLLGIGEATAVRCGPEVSAPDGVEAQTCVIAQGEETWARVYYRNTTGEPLDAALTLMGPGDRTVRTRCAPEGDDEPETCETPREHTRGAPSGNAGYADYTAVAEFARPGGNGELLLRAGSNTAPGSGG